MLQWGKSVLMHTILKKRFKVFNALLECRKINFNAKDKVGVFKGHHQGAWMTVGAGVGGVLMHGACVATGG